jgi:peptidoglycan/xylan/chitin deacetylase (PgdA/CDA1 family)
MRIKQSNTHAYLPFIKECFLLLAVLLIGLFLELIPGERPWVAHQSVTAISGMRHAVLTSKPGSQSSRPGVPLSSQITQILATQYMNALFTQHYYTMWDLLHPDVQAQWNSEAAFAAFWKARFRNYQLERFTVGQVKSLAFWVNPETMRMYKNLEEVPISLQLVPVASDSAQTQLPEVENPSALFQNLPFIVQHMPTAEKDKRVWYVLDGGPADLEAPILPPLIPLNTSVQVPILMYHHIADNNPPPYPFYWCVTIEHFTQQMDYLATHGYHTITFNQLFDALDYGWRLPSKPILLTFDDGLEDSYQNAYPILLKHHFTAMFYIVTGKVGLPGQMTWPQLHEMLAHGMQMGAHTIHHINLRITLAYNLALSQQELLQSKETLQQQLGIVVQHFCYPYGEPFYLGTQYEQRQVVKMLAADGYIDATVAVGVVSGTMQTAEAPFALPRVPVFGFENIYGFIARLPWQ